MRNPVKFAFSIKYCEYGIWGALGSLDQDFSEAFIAQAAQMKEGISTGGEIYGKGDPGTRREEVERSTNYKDPVAEGYG